MYPSNNSYSGYPPADYEANRSMGSRGPDRRSSLNNPSVGEGPMSDRMPMAPAGFDASGGFGSPGGFGGPGGFAEPGGFMVPSPNSGGFGNAPYPPVSGGGYPPMAGGYPPMSGGYPPAGGGGYPPASAGGYPPPGGARPPRPMGGGYPPQSPYGDFDSGYPPRPPPRNNQRPPMSAGPNMTGPGCSSSSLRPPPRPDQQMHQSAPNLAHPNRPPPRLDQQRPQSQQNNQGGGPQPSSFVSPSNNASTNNLPPKPSENRGLHWFQVNQQNTMIPASAVKAGKYGNDPVFIGRAPHKGSMQVGMVTMSKEGLVVTYDGKPLLFREYEVLCGPSSKYKWAPVHGRFDPKDIKGCRPFICGHEKSGESLYAATMELHGRDYVGKISAKGKAMLYSHKGKEDKAKDYSVLCEI
ncbi:hypothetical protein IWW36_004049 [Coemansia brasiliensis]|uniref:Uncharacterized protein n=1 Tax=Coemansia brasiliensis TaxID=2650707 RepID=A0A9W8IAG5_9FUNG|nr:hypothetical protein IWW36_004049 [Coemansia brasiliensis]